MDVPGRPGVDTRDDPAGRQDPGAVSLYSRRVAGLLARIPNAEQRDSLPDRGPADQRRHQRPSRGDGDPGGAGRGAGGAQLRWRGPSGRDRAGARWGTSLPSRREHLAMTGDNLDVEPRAGLRGPLLGNEVHVVEAESRGVSRAPLEVV